MCDDGKVQIMAPGLPDGLNQVISHHRNDGDHLLIDTMAVSPHIVLIPLLTCRAPADVRHPERSNPNHQQESTETDGDIDTVLDGRENSD